MSGHSVSVKRADEVKVGDHVNHGGVACRVTETWQATGEGVVLWLVVGDWLTTPVTYQPEELVEVMDK